MNLSLISVFFNDKDKVQRVMDSVLSQTYQDWEHIIVDGGSTDGTKELLEEYAQKYDGRLRYVSEKDNGIWDAANKALRMVRGECFLWVTDCFTGEHVLEKMMDKLRDPKVDGCFGGLYYVSPERKIIRRWSGKGGNWRLGWMAAFPTLCLRTKLYKEYGEFDEQFATVADYEYEVRMFLAGVNLVSIPEPLVIFEAGGVSNGGLMANLRGLEEGHRALRNHHVRFACFTDFCRILRALCSYTFASRKEIPQNGI